MAHEYNEKNNLRQITFRVDEALAKHYQILLTIEGLTTSAHLRDCMVQYVQANKHKITLK